MHQKFRLAEKIEKFVTSQREIYGKYKIILFSKLIFYSGDTINLIGIRIDKKICII